MARPLRIEGEGFWYHVIARGDDGRTLFSCEREHRHFLERLEQVAALFKLEIHAYALMRTHVHLFVRTPMANLGRSMQRLLTGYSVWYNRRNERTGHVFQGRYKAFVVDRDSYGLEVSRYIHLNPARALASHDLEELRGVARSYEWSSYAAYVGLAPAPSFLHIEDTLGRFGGVTSAGRANYAWFVEEGLLHDLPDLKDDVCAQSVLGSERFMERMRCLAAAHGSLDATAHRNKRRLCSVPIQRVIEAVAALYQVSPQELCAARRSRSEARRVLLWAAHTWCSGALSLPQIGAAMGGISGFAVSKAASRVSADCQHNNDLKSQLSRLEEQFTTVPKHGVA